MCCLLQLAAKTRNAADTFCFHDTSHLYAQHACSEASAHFCKAPCLMTGVVNTSLYVLQTQVCCAACCWLLLAGLGEHIADSPCQVQILPGAPSPRHSIVAGPGRKAAVAGCRADFTVSFRDAYGNPCSPTGVPAGGAASCSKHSSCDSGRFPGGDDDALQNQACVIEVGKMLCDAYSETACVCSRLL